jgi:hypothetical protein
MIFDLSNLLGTYTPIVQAVYDTANNVIGYRTLIDVPYIARCVVLVLCLWFFLRLILNFMQCLFNWK